MESQRLTGMAAIDWARSHGTTLSKHADPTEGARENVTPAEADAIAREDAGLIYVDVDAVRCTCGEWSGEPCQWSGPADETVTVEYMPEHLRSSHDAAGNRGSYPHNGARRIRVNVECADRMAECDGDWCQIVDRPTTTCTAEMSVAR